MTRRLTAFTIVCAAALTNIGFAALSRIFGYPDVLKEPTGEILARFSQHRVSVPLWFTVLAASAALLAPIAVGVGRLRTGRLMRCATTAGVAAATVQAIGLARWALLVPGYARAAGGNDPVAAANAESHFHTAHVVLGVVVGETFGYLLTALWTLLVVVALGRRFAGRAFGLVGVVAAVMIGAGVLSPLGLPPVDLATFAGYVLWSGWLVWLAVRLIRPARTEDFNPVSTETSPVPAII